MKGPTGVLLAAAIVWAVIRGVEEAVRIWVERAAR